MLRKAERRAEPVLDVGELLPRRPLALGKADDEVIAFVGLTAHVAGLRCLDLFDRPAGVVGLTIGDPCPGDLFALMRLVEDIRPEPRPARRVDPAPGVEDVRPQSLEIRCALLAGDAFGDHIRPAISASRPCSSAMRSSNERTSPSDAPMPERSANHSFNSPPSRP